MGYRLTGGRTVRRSHGRLECAESMVQRKSLRGKDRAGPLRTTTRLERQIFNLGPLRSERMDN